MIVTPCESNIGTVTEEHFLSENRHPDIVVNDDLPSTSFQTIKQIEVIKYVVLPNEVNLDDSVMNKYEGEQA